MSDLFKEIHLKKQQSDFEATSEAKDHELKQNKILQLSKDPKVISNILALCLHNAFDRKISYDSSSDCVIVGTDIESTANLIEKILTELGIDFSIKKNAIVKNVCNFIHGDSYEEKKIKAQYAFFLQSAHIKTTNPTLSEAIQTRNQIKKLQKMYVKTYGSSKFAMFKYKREYRLISLVESDNSAYTPKVEYIVNNYNVNSDVFIHNSGGIIKRESDDAFNLDMALGKLLPWVMLFGAIYFVLGALGLVPIPL